MQKLILRSDPVVLSFDRSPFCSRCNSHDDHWTVSCPTKSKDTDLAALSKTLDEEVESSEQDDELLSIPIEDEELIDDVKEEENSDELAMLLLHTSTVLQTSTS